jgi:hypothetical protein
VVHAGDWVVPELLDELEVRSARLLGVHGNNDGPELRTRLPEVARAELDGLCDWPWCTRRALRPVGTLGWLRPAPTAAACAPTAAACA